MRRLREVEPDCKILLVGNKVDLDEVREVTNEVGSNIANCYGTLFIETSAKSGNNVMEAFELLIKNILEKRLAQADPVEPVSLDVDNDSANKKCKC